MLAKQAKGARRNTKAVSYTFFSWWCVKDPLIDSFEMIFRFLELQNSERREKRLRKQAEEKASIARCPEACKLRKMHLEGENNKLRRDLMMLDEAKQNSEQQTRLYEQEVSFQV